jgi:hypothetical protein
MNPEMAFECLLVSHDPAVFGSMDQVLQDFSIRTNVCPNASIAANLLSDGGTDLVVIDLESKHSVELLQQICESELRHKPTILAVSAVDCAIPGAHVILRKPVTAESGARSLRAAYSRMLQDYRKHTRFALMAAVLATDEHGRIFSLTVTNVGEGGIGLLTGENLTIGSILSFRVQLPGLGSEIDIQARVLWTQPSGAAGCEFVLIPPDHLKVLHLWLESNYRFKKALPF